MSEPAETEVQKRRRLRQERILNRGSDRLGRIKDTLSQVQSETSSPELSISGHELKTHTAGISLDSVDSVDSTDPPKPRRRAGNLARKARMESAHTTPHTNPMLKDTPRAENPMLEDTATAEISDPGQEPTSVSRVFSVAGLAAGVVRLLPVASVFVYGMRRETAHERIMGDSPQDVQAKWAGLLRARPDARLDEWAPGNSVLQNVLIVEMLLYTAFLLAFRRAPRAPSGLLMSMLPSQFAVMAAAFQRIADVVSLLLFFTLYIQFGVPSPRDIRQVAEVEINHRDLYNADENNKPVEHGVLDPRLGISKKTDTCKTCGQNVADCVGHWGYIELCVPVFHYGYFKTIQGILQDICKKCSRVMLEEPDRRSFLRRLRMPGIDGLQTRALIKGVNDRCKKVTYCPYCGDTNGVVKKGGPLKIIHDKYRQKRTATEQEEFRKSLANVVEADPQLKPLVAKSQSEDMTPQRVYNLFKNISNEDCELMGLNPASGRPELFLWTCVPVPPVCIRPSVAQDGASNEDDLTVKLSEIIFTNTILKKGMDQGSTAASVMEQWDYLGLAIAMYINSEVPGAPLALVGKAIRGFTQRLKGKQGRFRGNLSGKRVDFSGRTVISPDPNMRIDEVAVPERVAKILTYPEVVTPHNME
ncbi:DNA-directed RNA polymerase III subunit C1 (rpo31), partial [Coemansia sp. RSA 521]